MINYQLDKNEIFTVVFKGTISFDEIIHFIPVLKETRELKSNLKVMYDLSEAELNLTPEQVSQISEVAIKATSGYKSIMAAFVVSKPKLTAYSMLFSSINRSRITIREVFSTKSAATDWLLGTRSV